MKEYLKNLNDEQKEAVKHFKGPCMVLAGPGTGKTTIIVNRIMSLIKDYGVAPANILVVTFTKAAAKEMENRFLNIKGYIKEYKEVTFGTFHSVFFRILKYYKNYKIENLINEKEKYTILKSIIRNLGYNFYEDEQALDAFANELSYIQNMLLDKKYNPSSCDYNQFWYIDEKYKKYKNERNKFDYEDMITHCRDLLVNNNSVLNDLRQKYKYILIDEFQDINKAQFDTIRLIAYPDNNLFAVGDDDQSIYGFRGADPNIIREFANLLDNVKIITLIKNYRNNKSILNSAMSVVSYNKNRYDKHLKTLREFGKLPLIVRIEDFEEEARVIGEKIKDYCKEGRSYSNIAVLYRTNIQSRAIIEAFIDKNIPFICREGLSSIYNHWIYNDIICYLKASQNIERNNCIYKILNKPYRYIRRETVLSIINTGEDFLDSLIGYHRINMLQEKKLKELKNNIEKIRTMKTGKAVNFIRKYIGYEEYIKDYAYSKHINVKPLLEVLDEVESSAKKFDDIGEYLKHINYIENSIRHGRNRLAEKNSVKVMTMHKAKGLEFNVVFITGVLEGLTPNVYKEELTVESLEEERRLFYVAMTRAKDELYLFAPKYRFEKRMEQSRFLSEMALWLKEDIMQYIKVIRASGSYYAREFQKKDKYNKNIKKREVDERTVMEQFLKGDAMVKVIFEDSERESVLLNYESDPEIIRRYLGKCFLPSGI